MTVGEEYGEVVSACHRYTASVSEGRPVGYHGKFVGLVLRCDLSTIFMTPAACEGIS